MRAAVPLVALVTLVLTLPALGIALVKPSVVGTTARASHENVRSIGYSIYYTLVNIGGALGPFLASWVHRHLSVENVFRMSALSVFIRFFAVLLFFREPQRSGDSATESLTATLTNFVKVIANPKFMDTERMLSTGPIIVIAFTLLGSVLTQRMAAFRAVMLGTLIAMLGFSVLALGGSVLAVYGTLVVVAVGELIQQPRYYDYISRLAPPGQQGTYMGFAFLPLGIGAFASGPIGGILLHHFGEQQHRPRLFLWALTAIGLLATLLLWIYDRVVKPSSALA